MCRDEVSRAHSNIVAAAIRAAEGIGLHEDGTARNYSAVQIHVRRLVWYQLLVLDIRTCEATGPRPQKRRGDFSTQIPLNVDEDLVHLSSVNSKLWSDMTVTIIRFRCNEFIRDIWTDRLLLKEGKTSIGEVLIKIQAFDTHMQAIYGKMADTNVPIQRYGCLIAKILTLRTYGMVLHQYALHPKVEMSGKCKCKWSINEVAYRDDIDNLKKIFIKYGVETMDAVQELETAQDLNRWRWLAGAIPQHHYDLAMILELLKDPYLSEAVPILKGLDYVFEPPQDLGLKPLTRVRCIVTEMRNRMEYYVNQRKMRVPRSTYGLEDLPDSEQFESSTSSSSIGNSATPREASPIFQKTGSVDEQRTHIAPMKSDSNSSRQSAGSSSNKVPLVPTFPHQNAGVSQRQLLDMDMVSSNFIEPSQVSIG